MVDRVLRIVLSLSLFFYFSKCKNDIFHLSLFFSAREIGIEREKKFLANFFPANWPNSLDEI